MFGRLDECGALVCVCVESVERGWLGGWVVELGGRRVVGG